MNFKDSHFVLTGASSGIGAEFLKLIEPQVASLMTLGRTALTFKNKNSQHFKMDFSLPLRTQLTDLPLEKNIDGLILCAGSDVNGRQPFLSQSFSVWEDTISVNFLRQLELIHYFLPLVLKSRLKTLMVLTSTNIQTPPKNCTAYTSAKTALSSALENLRKEYSNQGLRAIEIVPGLTKTNFAYNRSGDRATANQFYESFVATLNPADVASAMYHALSLDPSVSLSRIEIQPTLGDK
jgi:NADP-dependent 3-hydroxy acid dehydrogenase YdfG